MLLHATSGSRVPATMIIHPGFIKTGTTSLQVHAFGHPHQSAIRAYGLPLRERGYAA